MSSPDPDSGYGVYVFYSDADLDTGYTSDPTRSDNILDGSSYRITDAFIYNLLRGPVLPEEVVNTFDLEDPQAFERALLRNWSQILSYNAGLCVCVVLGLIMLLAMPTIGVFFCCFHC